MSQSNGWSKGSRKTISDDEIHKGHRINYTNQNLDFDLFERFLKGASVDDLSKLRLMSRQSVEMKIKITANSLKSNGKLALGKTDLSSMQAENYLWLQAVELTKSEELKHDALTMYNYTINWAKALSEKELRTLLDDLETIYTNKYGSII